MIWGILLTTLFLIPTPVTATIYKYVDKDGVIHFTDIPPEGKYTLIREKSNRYTPPSRSDYRQLAEEIARRHDIDPELVKRMIEIESGWNPYARSPKGAMGLMQIMPDTARMYGLRDPYDPVENIKAGVRYLRYLIDRFGDIRLALAAYNAGPTVVDSYGGIPPYPETIQYVKEILREGYENKREKIYRVVLEDGTILFTNSPVYTKGLRTF